MRHHNGSKVALLSHTFQWSPVVTGAYHIITAQAMLLNLAKVENSCLDRT